MISYQRLWDLMKEKGVSSYALIHRYGISSNQISRWKHGEDIKLSTLNFLCSVLRCDPSEILTFFPDDLSAVRLDDREVIVVSESQPDLPKNYGKTAKQNKKDPSRLAAKLNVLMQSKDLSPRRLSELSGVPLSTIRNIQYARSLNPRTKTLSSLANALGVPITELIDLPVEPPQVDD